MDERTCVNIQTFNYVNYVYYIKLIYIQILYKFYCFNKTIVLSIK